MLAPLSIDIDDFLRRIYSLQYTTTKGYELTSNIGGDSAIPILLMGRRPAVWRGIERQLMKD